MKKITILALVTSFFVSAIAVANEVNVFNARHYKADAELYSKFTSMTGIKVNLINGKSGALEKRIIEEGTGLGSDLQGTVRKVVHLCSRAPARAQLHRKSGQQPALAV